MLTKFEFIDLYTKKRHKPDEPLLLRGILNFILFTITTKENKKSY